VAILFTAGVRPGGARVQFTPRGPGAGARTQKGDRPGTRGMKTRHTGRESDIVRKPELEFNLGSCGTSSTSPARRPEPCTQKNGPGVSRGLVGRADTIMGGSSIGALSIGRGAAKSRCSQICFVSVLRRGCIHRHHPVRPTCSQERSCPAAAELPRRPVASGALRISVVAKDVTDRNASKH
jgi:hypothetical protein